MPRSCRSCGSTDGQVVLDLGHQPSAEQFRVAGGPPTPRHPLRLWMCGECHLAQLEDDPGGTTEQTPVIEPVAVAAQARATLAWADELGLTIPGSRVVELGSPHGHSWEALLRQRALQVVPADGEPGGVPVDLVVDVHGLLHQPDQHAALAARAALVGDTGSLLCQLHPLGSAVAAGQFFELRHGHFAYWSLPALEGALAAHGLGVHRARVFDHDHGTAVVVARRGATPDAASRAVIDAEAAATDPSVVRGLQHDADRAGAGLRRWLEAERAAGRWVAAYGAASRAAPLLLAAGVDVDLLPRVADAAPAKQGCTMPGTRIPIVAPSVLAADPPDRVLLLLDGLLDEVVAALPEVRAAGGDWVVLDLASRTVVGAASL